MYEACTISNHAPLLVLRVNRDVCVDDQEHHLAWPHLQGELIPALHRCGTALQWVLSAVLHYLADERKTEAECSFVALLQMFLPATIAVVLADASMVVRAVVVDPNR